MDSTRNDLVDFVKHIGQGIPEWTKYNSWKTALNKFEVIWSADYMHITG